MTREKTYNPGQYEQGIYELWLKNGTFIAQPTSLKKHYSISMPPPNETGTLHVGHALFVTLQDILIRHHRALGYDCLWLPGTDHAAIATNALIEQKLTEQGTNKHIIGREKFIALTKEFVKNSRETINKQIKLLGASADWSRARYTLDEGLSRIVSEVFVRMYEDGLIYRGNRIVNWDPKLETTVSDDEVEYKKEITKLYTFKFGPFEISTTRPETKFGDKYVVVNPKDKRYLKFKHLDKFEAEWINGKVNATVIKDFSVDPSFGTGAMTITPWHSQVDFELAKKYNLEMEQVIDFKGNLLPIAQEFQGMNILEARPKIVKKLKSKGLLVSVDDNYEHNLALNSRGKGTIEPQIKTQWFIDVNKKNIYWKDGKYSFKEVLQKVIREGDIKIIPKKYEKIYFNWIDNLRDWCISRQIWWGHQIPAWYKDKRIYVGTRPPTEKGFKQDQDTLDTWFSSSLWSWSTLLDPKLILNQEISLDQILSKSIDFQTYHPTSVLETGSDILFFWVARMILSTTYITQQVPFKEVYLHGLVRTSSGKKMSKSDPSSAIDPVGVIQEYGADALRLSLIQGLAAGQDSTINEAKIITNRNFCNKLWNIANFIENKLDFNLPVKSKTMADDWILGKLELLQKKYKNSLNNYQFSEAYNLLYHFLRDDFADWYIEVAKIEQNFSLLSYVYKNVLILAHPLAPFITETLWQRNIAKDKNSLLANQTYSKVIGASVLGNIDLFENLKSIISELRKIKNELKLSRLNVASKDDFIKNNKNLIEKLTNFQILVSDNVSAGTVITVFGKKIVLDINKFQLEEYLKKLNLVLEEQENRIKNLKKRLANKQYLLSAPSEIVEESRIMLSEEINRLNQTKQDLKIFS